MEWFDRSLAYRCGDGFAVETPRLAHMKMLIQFKLRTLLLCVTLCGTTLGWIGWQRNVAEKQSRAIVWLNDPSNIQPNTWMGIDDYYECADASCTRPKFLRDDLDPYMRPVFGPRYLGADRLRLLCGEDFAFNADQIDRLSDLVDLKTISLFAYTLTDEQLLTMTKLTRVENLILMGANEITDESAVHIAKMPNLYEFELSASKITDTTLEALCRCPRLQLIDLECNDQISFEAAYKLCNTLKPIRFNVARCAKISPEEELKLLRAGTER